MRCSAWPSTKKLQKAMEIYEDFTMKKELICFDIDNKPCEAQIIVDGFENNGFKVIERIFFFSHGKVAPEIIKEELSGVKKMIMDKNPMP